LFWNSKQFWRIYVLYTRFGSCVRDESMLCQGLALNDDLQRLLAKHEAIASGNSMIKKEEKSKKEVPKDTTQIIDVGSR